MTIRKGNSRAITYSLSLICLAFTATKATANNSIEERHNDKITSLSSHTYLKDHSDEPLIKIEVSDLKSAQENLASGVQSMSFQLSENATSSLEVEGQLVEPGDTVNFDYLVEQNGQIELPVKNGEDSFNSSFEYTLSIDRVFSHLDYREIEPPDQYTKVYDCPAGSNYNEDSNQCLKSIGCLGNDTHYYSVSQENGLTVMNDSLLYQSATTNSCIPVSVGQFVYTCGELQASGLSGKVYELCTNEVIDAANKHCPSSSHKVSPSSGYCEVPPLVTCESGYDLVLGGDVFDSSDDSCVTQTYTYQKVCPSGYALVGEQCEKIVSTSPTYSCSSGSLSGTQCFVTSTQCRYQDGVPFYYAMSTKTGSQTTWRYYWNHQLVTGSNYWLGNLKREWVEIHRQGGDKDTRYYHTSYEICSNVTTTHAANKSCSSGYTLSNNQCYKTLIDSYTPTCQENFELNEGNTFCHKSPSQVPAQQSCPVNYPNWISSEKRCAS